MRRVTVIATLSAALAFSSALGVVACGGNQNPPLQPDSEHPMLSEDAGAPATPPASAVTPSSAPAPTTK